VTTAALGHHACAASRAIQAVLCAASLLTSRSMLDLLAALDAFVQELN
jgi:hypothetical protein